MDFRINHSGDLRFDLASVPILILELEREPVLGAVAVDKRERT